MNKSLVFVIAIAFALIAIVACSPEADNVEPTVAEGDQLEGSAENAIDNDVVAEDDEVELGELV